MTGRKRYHQLHDLLSYGWRLFSATASDQLHVAARASEVALLTSVCNAATPAILALCGNSAVHSGVALNLSILTMSGPGKFPRVESN